MPPRPSARPAPRPAEDPEPHRARARPGRSVVLAGAALLAAAPAAGAQSVGDTLTAPPAAVAPSGLFGRDRIVTTPGAEYPAGPIHRFFFGDLHREIWTIPFEVPVLDLDSVAGGLEVEELSGGKQTLGLRFRGRDGQTYQFRSIVKTPSRAIPAPLLRTPVDEVFQDQMAAQFPLGAMVVAEFLEEAGILVAKPRPVLMPDDPRLGELRPAFAGRMGWIEVRPNEREGDRPGFAGSSKITGSEALFERLREDPANYVDQQKLLRARLVDFLVGDWDRHMDQWRWASFEEGDRVRWEPIPRDRDWAFSRIDGALARVVARYFPQYVGFEPAYPSIPHLIWSAQLVDRTLLQGVDRSDVERAAAELQRRFDDAMIERAVGVLPRPYLEAIGAELTATLKARRDHLDEIAAAFYGYLAGWVDVFGTDEAESLSVERRADGRLRVTLTSLEGPGPTLYERTFVPDETHEVRVYLRDGDDEVRVHGSGPAEIRLHVVPGDGDDRIVDETDGRRVGIYGDAGDDELDVADGTFVTDRFEGDEEIDDAYWAFSRRDWGTTWIPRPEFRYESDLGAFVGASLTRYGYGFQYDPYRSRYHVAVLNGFEPDQWLGSLEFERPYGTGTWRAWFGAEGFTERSTWFYGFGNETPAPASSDVFKSQRSSLTLGAGLRLRPDDVWEVTVGPTFTVAGAVEPGSPQFDAVEPYGSSSFQQVGAMADVRFTTRDDPQLPTSGVVLDVTAHGYPSALDVEEAFGVLRGTARTYLSAELPLDPALHLRAHGETSWGRVPYGELPYLGGSTRLPGFTRRRFLGESMVSGTALLRLKLLELSRLSGTSVGVHGLASSGRVWLDGEDSDTWHTGAGGGLWIHLQSIGRTFSVSFVDGDEGIKTYLDFGFVF